MIQELSVNIVKDYVTAKVPLDDGIAKVASELELNSDQIKRVTETCNTITYLTLHKAASDKTLEFPVAKYENVMAKIALPGDSDTSVAVQEFKEATASETTEKQAEYIPDVQTMQAWSRAEYIRNKAILEKLAIDSEAVVQNIGDVSARLRKDQYALEKLAEVTTEDEFKKLSHLIGPVPEKLEDRIFRDNELSEAKRLVELYKEACDIAAEKERRSTLEKRANVIGAAGGLGTAIGGLVGKGITGAATGVKTVIQNIGKKKAIHPLDIAATVVTKPEPSTNVWDNLQGTQRRF